ncbi:MAG TPA: hypothetical protein VH333_02075 [Pseudonocardiaceae bacterium]|jgi:hypothetical protein|nr:hypothetical protein [Pseudonocardiaceae bacterium]
MTGIDRRRDTPMGPPWPVDVLADLHAGALDDRLAQRLWPLVRQDREASAVLDALDATRAELSGLAATPPIPMPAHFAARLDAAVAVEAATRFGIPVQAPPTPTPSPLPQQPVAPVIDLARARRRRNQRLGWGAGVLVAAAAVAVAVIGIPRGATSGTPSAGDTALALHSGQINGGTLAAVIGHTDYGPLADPAKRAGCLAANGQNPDQTPAGVLPVTLDGRPGVLFVLTTGELAQYRLLVVGPDCATGNPDRLDNLVIGGITTPPTR